MPFTTFGRTKDGAAGGFGAAGFGAAAGGSAGFVEATEVVAGAFAQDAAKGRRRRGR